MFKCNRILSLTSIVSTLATSATLLCAELPEKPFRMGVIVTNRELDQVKPLAESDYGGFVLRGDVLIGSYDKLRIRAYNIETHKNLWWQTTDGELTAPPLVVENTVFFSTRSGQLLALNVTTGERIWETVLDSYSERPLTFSNGNLFVVTAGQVAYSIEASSGKRLWVHDAGFPDMVILRRPPAPLIHDGRMIVGLASGELLGLKLDDGKKLWRYNPFYQEARFKDVIGDLVIHNGKLLMSRYDGLIALIDLAQERQVIWQERQTSVSTSTYRAGRFYVGFTNGDLQSFDASSGRSIWRAQIGTAATFLIASETNLYVICNNGRIVSVDIATGELKWADDVGSRIGAAPIVVGNKMYVSTGLRNIYGYMIK